MQDFKLNGTPLLLPLIAFVGGLIVSQSGCPLWLAIVPALLGVVLYRAVGDAVGIFLIVVSAGMIDGALNRQSTWPQHLDGVDMRYAAIVRDVAETENGRRILMSVDSVGEAPAAMTDVNKVLVSVNVPSLFPVVDVGQYVSFKGALSESVSRIDLPDEIDYTKYLRASGVRATGIIHPDSLVVGRLDQSPVWKLRRLRTQAVRMMMQSQLSDEAGVFLSAVIMGDTSVIPVTLREKFGTVGIAHVLALSGLHVGIITCILMWLLWPLSLVGVRGLRYLCVIVLLWCYAFITGMSPSVTRAGVMASVFLLGLAIERRSSSFNALFLAALIILVADPSALTSVGFQLSFVAVLSILVATTLMTPLRKRAQESVGYRVMSIVVVSVVVVVGTGVVSAYYFHVFPVYSILSNLLITIILPWILGGGLLLLSLECMGFDPIWLCNLLNHGVEIVCYIADIVSVMPYARLEIYFDRWVIAVYFVGLALCAIYFINRRIVWPVAGALVLCGGAMWLNVRPLYPESELFVVRERDCTNVIIRDSDKLLIHTTMQKHGQKDLLEKCRKKYADYMGCRRISEMRLVDDTIASSLSVTNRLIRFYDKRLLVMNSNDAEVVVDFDKLDYLIVCKGFTGDILELSSTLSVDTVLLSCDINRIRHNRYASELDEAGFAWRSLRDAPLRIVRD